MSVQDYASERLGADRSEAAVRHGAWFARQGSPEALEAFHGVNDVQLREATLPDLDNLVSASRRALARGDLETATLTVPVCWALIELRGPITLGRDLLEAVVDRMPRSDTRWSAFARLAGEANDRSGRMDDARSLLDEALAAAREAGDRRREGLVLMAQGVCHNHLGLNEEAAVFFESALEAAAESGDTRTEGRSHTHLGTVKGHLSGIVGSREHLHAALEILPALGDWFEAIALAMLKSCCLVIGDIEGGRAHLERAVAMATKRGATGLLAHVADVLGRPNACDGRWDEGLAMVLAARTTSRTSGSILTGATTLLNLAWMHRMTGRWDEHRTWTEHALVANSSIGSRSVTAKVLYELGWSQAEEGALTEARSSAEESLSISRALGARADEGDVLLLLAHLDAQDDRAAEASAKYLQAETILRDCSRTLGLLSVLVARAVHEAPRDREAAERCLAEAEAIPDRTGPSPETVWQGQVRNAREALARQ